MAIKKEAKDRFVVSIRRAGFPRVLRVFTSLEQAVVFEREFLAKHSSANNVAVEAVGDRRKLSELIELWFRYHGKHLADGKARHAILIQMAVDLDNPVACELSPEQFLAYRFNQSTGQGKPPSDKTLNNRQGYLDAVFRKLKKLKIIDYASPLAETDKIKLHERQSSFLSETQIVELFAALKVYRNEYVWWIAQICIRTGARWGEVERLTRKQLHNGKVTFEFTKSKKVRSVPLDEDFYQDLLKFVGYKQPEERIFKNAIVGFNRCIKKAGIKLPKGQATHILRHSFASYFIMNGGNILVLQKILGHSDIKMTMRYAHLAPDHFTDAVKFNPLSAMTGSKTGVDSPNNS